MRNDGYWSTGLTTCDRSYYAVFHMQRVAGAGANCVMRMWNVAFCACYRNFNLPFAAKCVLLNGVEK